MAIELARALLAHEPRSIAMLDQMSPCADVPSSFTPAAVIAGLPAQVHLHYLKALMDWAVSQLVRPQPHASGSSGTAARAAGTTKNEAGGTGQSQATQTGGNSRGDAAAKGAKVSQKVVGNGNHPRDVPASWDILTSLVVAGCWGGADVASAVPVSILQSATAACQRACHGLGASENMAVVETEGTPRALVDEPPVALHHRLAMACTYFAMLC